MTKVYSTEEDIRRIENNESSEAEVEAKGAKPVHFKATGHEERSRS